MTKAGFVRISAGEWRGRRLKVPDVKEVRPTPDRVRETVFNWLVPYIPGSYCLDLFAGSGVLGFEALSRGAQEVVMVDQSKEVIDLLQKEKIDFSAHHALIYQARVPEGLKQPTRPFDIVFLDPPFRSNLLLPCCFYLEEYGFLASSAYLYLEAETIIKDNELTPHWHILKCKHAGQVVYHLAHRETI